VCVCVCVCVCLSGYTSLAYFSGAAVWPTGVLNIHDMHAYNVPVCIATHYDVCSK